MEDSEYDGDSRIGWEYSDEEQTLRLWMTWQGERTDVAVANGRKRETRLDSIPCSPTEAPHRQWLAAAIGMQVLANHASGGARHCRMALDGCAIEFDNSGEETDLPLTVPWADGAEMETLRSGVIQSLMCGSAHAPR